MTLEYNAKPLHIVLLHTIANQSYSKVHLWRHLSSESLAFRCVQENLRQLCVFQLANQSGQSYRWWEYVTKFGEECTMAGNQYNEACAERV